jgi:arylamine N-acetyltransferase
MKRQRTSETELCPRWPEDFWEEALNYGMGGTCFESNLAFFTLLNELRFDGYLTINDMETPACHAASIVTLNGQKYLADVTIPIHCALPVYADQITRRSNEFHHYTIHPESKHRYAIERSHHPKRRAYTLVDLPIPIEEYRNAVQEDYGETGYFLDRVVIVKVIEDRLWCFSSEEVPFKIEGFDKRSKKEVILEKNTLAKSLSEHFGIDEDKIAAALLDKHVIG